MSSWPLELRVFSSLIIYNPRHSPSTSIRGNLLLPPSEEISAIYALAVAVKYSSHFCKTICQEIPRGHCSPVPEGVAPQEALVSALLLRLRFSLDLLYLSFFSPFPITVVPPFPRDHHESPKQACPGPPGPPHRGVRVNVSTLWLSVLGRSTPP